MSRISFIFGILILISASTVYLNYKVFNSYRIQTGVTIDFNSQNLKEENYIKLMNLDLDFPNLSATSFPLYAFLAKYHIAAQRYNEALELLEKENNVNPYLRVIESLKAEAYLNLGIRDSSYHYSKIAFENLPQNARHFQQYLQELVFRNKLEEIKQVFEASNAKSDPQFWLIYFSSVIKLKEQNDSVIEKQANQALKKFPRDNNIKTIAAFILFGQEQITLSYELAERASNYFSNDEFTMASENFIQASELNPIEYTFFESAGMSLIKENKFEQAIPFFRKVIDSMNPNTGKSEFGLAVCYQNLGDKDLACKFIDDAIRFNYKPAFNKRLTICN